MATLPGMQEQTRGTLEMAAAMAISGTIGWLVVSSGQPVPALLFWRCLLGALTLLGFCLALGVLRPLPRRIAGLAALGGVAIVANWLLLFASFAHIPISVATVVYNVQPFMLVAFGAMVLRERPTPASIAWMLLAFGGVVLVAQARPSAGPDGHPLLGLALALGAAFLYAVAALVARRLKGTPPHLIALVQMVVGSAMLAPWMLGAGQAPADARAWGFFLAIGVVYTGVMYILLYGALQKLPTTRAGMLSFLYPLVAVAVDHVAFGVRLGPLQWAGAACILGAVGGLNLAPALTARRRAA
jgi:drug/metabolite transporter (DMT)-like permease